MTVHYSDDQVTLHHGDALAVLEGLPAESVHCVVTSPPYYGLRDYGEPGQYGLEASPAEYVDRLRTVFAEARRVLVPDGTLWLNLGDSYARGGGQGNCGPASTLQGGTRPSFREDRAAAVPARPAGGLPGKSLLGIPWRVAFALQDDGWVLRSEIIWAKSNSMPESVTDRPAKMHEQIFLFTPGSRYWFDLDAIRQPHAHTTVKAAGRSRLKPYRAPGQKEQGRNRSQSMAAGGANPGSVWALPTQPFPAGHFAVMPPALAERCLLAGCRPGGTVLDPFCGSGTTGMVALRHARRFVGIDLSATYLDLALRTRLRQGALIPDDPSAAEAVR